jgi:hypothetical protein
LEHDVVATGGAVDASPAGYRVRHVVVGWYAYSTLWYNDINAGLGDSPFFFVNTTSPIVRGVSVDKRSCHQGITYHVRKDHVDELGICDLILMFEVRWGMRYE